MTSLYLDITEFINLRTTTGIQRCLAMLYKYWHDDDLKLFPVKIVSDNKIVLLPPQCLDNLVAYFHADKEERQHLNAWFDKINRNIVVYQKTVAIDANNLLLCLEHFFDKKRIAFYQNLLNSEKRQNVFMYFHDIFPLTKPEYFDVDASFNTYPFFRLTRQAVNSAFPSYYTAKEINKRLLGRSHKNARVIPLGCDSLGKYQPVRTQIPSNAFVVISSIEPRKNHPIIIEAFKHLWEKKVDVNLIFIGRFYRSAVNSHFINSLEELYRKNDRFHWYKNADDYLVRKIVKNARALINVSSDEGFGLSLLEAMHFRIPVIASSGIPSIERHLGKGMIALSELSPSYVEAAIIKMLNEDFHRSKKSELDHLSLHTWKDFANEIASWIKSTISAQQDKDNFQSKGMPLH